MNRKLNGFTLIEIAVVTAIIGILAMIVTPSFVDMLQAKRIEAEKSSLTSYEEDIKRSFQDSDWSRNIAAFTGPLSGTMPTTLSTTFGDCPAGTLATDAAWIVKLGRMRGIEPAINQAINADQQKSLYDIAYNGCSQTRMLIAGPTNEAGLQRYLLISLMASENKGLVIPTNDGSSTWFDAIWNNDWENEGGGLPAYWINNLSSTDASKWLTGPGATTNCHLLVVRRIVQPKYSITINNTHQTYSGWVVINGQIITAAVRNPNDPPYTISDVLGGTQVLFYRGTSTTTGTEAYCIKLNDNTTFFVQP